MARRAARGLSRCGRGAARRDTARLGAARLKFARGWGSRHSLTPHFSSHSITQPNFEEDFCTFLLSDIEYGGVNAHADLEQKVAKEVAAAAAKAKK